MARKVHIEVEVDMSDFSDEDIRAEYHHRELGNLDAETGDIRLLADMVAAKETDRALDHINTMFPEAVSVAFAKKNAEWRSGEVLF